uniref:Putative viral movement protein n=1 Tax=Helianthus annuus TaxID=4232 RepID=A0A251T9F0_HELAN
MTQLSRFFSKRDYSSNNNDEEDENINSLHMNSVEINISQIENNLLNRNIPKQDVKTIYRIGTFDFLQDYSIKTHEQTIPINKDYQNMQLLSVEAIKRHRKLYKFLHIGLVQVAIKPMFRLGIDAPVLLILRDARHTNFNNSLLAMAESNISNGPIYFNCYPNFSIGLFDPNILDTLTLTIKTKNLEFKEKTNAAVVIYRIYYKTMTTTIEPKTKLISPKDETVIFEANTIHTKIRTPKKLKWNEITQSLTWNLQDINPPKPIEIENQTSNIVEHSDGSIDISFSSILPRHSIGASTNARNTINENLFRRSLSMKMKGVDFSNTIPRPLYEENDSDNNTYVATKSDMENYEELQ